MENNPLTWIDPSGHQGQPSQPSVPQYGSTEFGNIIHSMVQQLFKIQYTALGLGNIAETEVKVPKWENKSGYGRADIVIKHDGEDQAWEVFEVKPATYAPKKDPAKYKGIDFNKQGKDQLQSYIDGFKSIGQPAIAGISWNPNGIILPHPFNPKKEIVLRTYFGTDPGMIYYDERNISTNGDSGLGADEVIAGVITVVGGIILNVLTRGGAGLPRVVPQPAVY